jgi:hypothetical protein
MSVDHNKVKLTDLSGRHDVSAEVSWDERSEISRAIKLKVGENVVVIPFEEVYSLVYLMANPQESEDMLPVRKTFVKKIVKMHVATAKKNIKKGEEIRLRCETDVPVEVVEGLKKDVMGGKLNGHHRHDSFSIPIIGLSGLKGRSSGGDDKEAVPA